MAAIALKLFAVALVALADLRAGVEGPSEERRGLAFDYTEVIIKAAVDATSIV